MVNPSTGRAMENNSEILPALVDNFRESQGTPPHRITPDKGPLNTPEGKEHETNHTDQAKKELAETYVKIMNFQHGDLLYGLEESRQFIREILEKQFGAVTIDSYNNVFLSINKAETRNWENLDIELESHLLEKNSKLIEENHRWIKDYAKFLFNDGIFGHIEDSVVAENKKFKKVSCKYAVIFSKLWGSKIHFVLDQIDPSPVILKGVDDFDYFSGERYSNSYTASELRYLYRMWLNNHDSIDHVFFYHSGKRIESPPWVSRPEFWMRYKPKSHQRIETEQSLIEFNPKCQQNIQLIGTKRKRL